jgi:alpha-ribazole phosphatase
VDIYLIRHTRGRSDVTLAPEFQKDALEVKRKLSFLKLPAVFSSPAIRCRALAEFLSPKGFDIDGRLEELDFGSWEMKPWASIPRKDIDHWANDYLSVGCPGGESLQDMMTRVLAFWKGLVHQSSSDIILVTHAGPIRIILSFIQNVPPHEMFSIPVDFGSIRKITRQDGNAISSSLLE